MQHKKPALLVPTELVHKRPFAQHADRALILAKRALSGNLRYDPYWVEDVKTRQCVAASAAATLSQERAAATLLDGHRRLSGLGLAGSRLVQSDAGSDFTSSHFQKICQNIGQWVRCRVAQVGGMGILERLNRTFKYEFVFRQEVNTLADLKALLPAFQRWYNEQRLYSSVGYRTPATVLAHEVAAAAILS